MTTEAFVDTEPSALDPAEPFSALTAWFYPVAGAWIYLVANDGPALFTMLALALLGAGTWAYHTWPQKEWARDLDHAGMNAAFMAAATATVGAPWWGVAGNGTAGALAEYIGDFQNYALMGGLVVLMVAAGGYGGASLFGLSCMALGYVAWSFESDIAHGIWHLLTAVGTCFLYLGA